MPNKSQVKTFTFYCALKNIISRCEVLCLKSHLCSMFFPIFYFFNFLISCSILALLLGSSWKFNNSFKMKICSLSLNNHCCIHVFYSYYSYYLKSVGYLRSGIFSKGRLLAKQFYLTRKGVHWFLVNLKVYQFNEWIC